MPESYFWTGCKPPHLANVDSFCRSPENYWICGEGDRFQYRKISDFITHGIVLHQSGEYQAVSEVGGSARHGDLGLYEDIREAAFKLVMSMKSEGLLDRHWKEIING